MNFKTTIALIVLLAAAGAYLFFTREHPAADQSATPAAGNLLDIASADVTQVHIAPADGTPFTLEKSNATWQLTQPVKAAAETFEVDSLVRAFTDAKTTGSVPASDASATGLDHPRDVVELVTPSKTVKLNIGDRTVAGGDNLYVQVDGQSKVQMISAAEIADRLAKGPDAYRNMSLVTVAADQIKQITITPAPTPKDPNPQKIELQKQGTAWHIVQPIDVLADDSAASDLTYALTGLRADSYVSAHDVPASATARPQLTIAYSTDAPPAPPPATAPSTQPNWHTVAFGSPVDILGKNVYVALNDPSSPDTIAQVPVTTLDSFRKTPLDLRDKTIVDFDPNVVKAVSLVTNLPSTTQPTTRPATNTTIALTKRPVAPIAMGPTKPTTQASTKPATTAPAVVQSKWLVDATKSADDAKVTTLLTALHPLKADKFLATAPPATQPADSYTLTITTTGPFGSNIVEHTLHIQDPGHDAALNGSYNGLQFELPRTLLTDLQGAWEKK